MPSPHRPSRTGGYGIREAPAAAAKRADPAAAGPKTDQHRVAERHASSVRFSGSGSGRPYASGR
ncbi:hypothetical protein FRAAL5569 [Frankia alni ACN14a]|uniref:Uncharacterized protein n=1 Tax=Frankia alni (strain DSM 45986 / CECT 9034 / ACN14a) TaxID=326424 RepID=Q0REA8_FRAAA|nr:hypothetical protein FRAAL5569 [Frankia alni ACN14a]